MLTFSRRFISTFIVCSLLAVASFAGEDDKKWVSMFNGKDLTGWMVVGGDETAWGVTDGFLHTAKSGKWLATEKEYANFEVELEFNMPPGGNSGVFLRSPLEGDSAYVGMEIQLLDDFTEVFGKLQPWQMTGSIYNVVAAKPGATKKAEEWQKISILADGRKLKVTLNGKVIVDADLDGFPDAEAKHPGLKRTTGYVGLQNYGGRKVLFRNIRIREIASDS